MTRIAELKSGKIVKTRIVLQRFESFEVSTTQFELRTKCPGSSNKETFRRTFKEQIQSQHLNTMTNIDPLTSLEPPDPSPRRSGPGRPVRP